MEPTLIAVLVSLLCLVLIGAGIVLLRSRAAGELEEPPSSAEASTAPKGLTDRR